MTSDHWGGVGKGGDFIPFTTDLGETAPMPIDLHKRGGGRVDMRGMVADRLRARG